MMPDTNAAAISPVQQDTADFYGGYFWKNYRVQEDNFLDFIVAGIGLPRLEKAGTLLDIGAGSGKFSILLKRRFPHLKVTAVDLSPENIRTIQNNARKAGVSLEAGTASALELPFADGAFDLVVCAYMLQHTVDPWQGFRESTRVLNTGGTAFYAIGRDNRLGILHRKTRSVFKRVPAGLRSPSVFPALPFYCALTYLLKRRKASYREMVKDMVDWFYNPLQNFIREDDVQTWFRQCGLSFEKLGYTGLFNSMLICRGQKQIAATQ